MNFKAIPVPYCSCCGIKIKAFVAFCKDCHIQTILNLKMRQEIKPGGLSCPDIFYNIDSDLSASIIRKTKNRSTFYKARKVK